ncbi:G2/M phase-specific E3 ubiquitin-protein ligase [Cheilinus undulatus]|uniref:G2/M phase-specific E3 ubiquitin-protein ligase n=1 Tax=Cheilinus undulatus TaxID=241271 RepID=UPI001BD621F8|nr:G2/M phase-specific E3 ubiquitin-protein ligase [Cheilinus undulatus]
MADSSPKRPTEGLPPASPPPKKPPHLSRKPSDKAKGKTRVNIGLPFPRWRALRDAKKLSHDSELALLLMDAFKDGLASLMFLEALCQHPAVLAPVLCCKDKKLTAIDIEQLFMPLLSSVGSNTRRTENLVLSFWSDYIMDCEEQGPVSLEELLMFATGLRSLPSAGMTPHPSLSFLEESIYPMANTCSNTIKLPLLPAYDLFKKNMGFGIQNLPGFGCPLKRKRTNFTVGSSC